MCFVVIVLLTVVGLAVDAGNLYRSQLALQKATDAAVLAGVGYAIQIGQNQLNTLASTDPDGAAGILQPRARLIARANLRAAKVTTEFNDSSIIFHPAIYRPNPNDTTIFEFEMTIEKDINYFIVDKIPFFLIESGSSLTDSGQHRIAATATASRSVANVAVMLDVSDSMNCPSTGSCACLATNSCTGRLKVDDLIDASKEFLKMFDASSDNLVAVPFNIAAVAYSVIEVATDLGIPIESISEPQIDAIVDELKSRHSPVSSTNICDALLRSWEKIQDLAPGQEAAYVLISEGAPNAGRFLIPNPPGAILPWNPHALGAVTHDYTHYSVKWSDANGDRQGPSLLVQTDLIGIGWDNPVPFDLGGDGVTVPAVSTCAAPENPPIPFSLDPNATLEIEAPKAFNGCIADLGFHVPENSALIYGRGGSPDDPDFHQWRKQYYNCAVAYSDFMREQKGMLYAIGVGNPATIGTDPYQDIANVLDLKHFLMTRIANDFMDAITIPRQAGTPWQHPEFNFTGYKSYDDWNNQSVPRQGDFLIAPTTSDLTALFRKIARKIQMRLVA